MSPALLADPHPLARGPPVLAGFLVADGERHAVRGVGVRGADDGVQHGQRLLTGEGRPEEAVLVVRGVTLQCWENLFIKIRRVINVIFVPPVGNYPMKLAYLQNLLAYSSLSSPDDKIFPFNMQSRLST